MPAGTAARMAVTTSHGNAPSAPAAGFFASTKSAPSDATRRASRSSVTLASILADRRTCSINFDEV
jgi:hypothetical protein